jgi:hypothetical protein
VPCRIAAPRRRPEATKEADIMGTTLELSSRELPTIRRPETGQSESAEQRRARRRDLLACVAAMLALVGLMVGGIVLRVIMFVPH